MNGWFVAGAIAIAYSWIAGYVSARYPVKSMCCGAALEETSKWSAFPSCVECGESSLWAKERTFTKVAFWPIAVPMDLIITAGRKAGKRKN